MAIKLYVAGKFSDKDRIKDIMNFFTSQGDYKITKDWTTSTVNDEGYPVKNCLADTQGVIDADAFVGVYINKEYIYRGSIVEFGIALGNGKRCIFIGHGMDSCIFTNHPLVTVVEDRWEAHLILQEKLKTRKIWIKSDL